ncbi:MAG: hypothetical protein JNL11_07145 [Bdellovibrionaceae bacterium]|nr:hypothetical protein [Pseudobdellovibrionaceae bacterium]
MIKTFLTLLSILLFLSFLQPAAAQTSETEEYSYEELLDKIKTKQKKYIKSTASTPWDQIYLYPSFAIIQAYTKISDGISPNFYHSGLQISLGMDLFSEHWFSETAFRNFGASKTETKELFLKELDFKIGHKNYLSDQIEYRFSLGVSTRTIRLSDETTGFHQESKNPALISSVGILSTLPNSPILLGLEFNYRSLLVANEFDKGSMGLNFIFMGYF